MTSMPHLAAMEWDFGDRFQHAQMGTGSGATHAYFVYDAAGNRVRKVWEKSAGLVEERIYIGNYEVWRKHLSGTLDEERETLHVIDDRARVVMVETKTIASGIAVSSPTSYKRYQLDDLLGSSRIELDASAALLTYEEYHPYGTTAFRASSGSSNFAAKRYRYTGKERDEETGLYYYGARYYPPWLGRWTAVDPAGMVDGPNVYQYVRGNPVTLTDPDGRASFIDAVVGPKIQEQQNTEKAEASAATRSLDSTPLRKGDAASGMTVIPQTTVQTEDYVKAKLKYGEAKAKYDVRMKAYQAAEGAWQREREAFIVRYNAKYAATLDLPEDQRAAIGRELSGEWQALMARRPIAPVAPTAPTQPQIAIAMVVPPAAAPELLGAEGAAVAGEAIAEGGLAAAEHAAKVDALVIHPRLDRFYVTAGELAEEGAVIQSHPLNNLQYEGGAAVGHGGVKNLPNEDLLKFGGPQGTDPISGFRSYTPGADMSLPGNRINIVAGHHRVFEIGRRVNAGQIAPTSLVEFMLRAR